VFSADPNEKDKKKNWRLKTSVQRFLEKHGKKIDEKVWMGREAEHINRFRSTAKGFLSNYPDDDDLISWLGLMQHYGYPTRLLDFTFNPAIALYFALENASPETNHVGVHAIRIDSIRDYTQEVRGVTKERSPDPKAYMIGKKGQTHEFLGVNPGKWTNERQEAQEGVYLVPSKIDMDIEEWLRLMPKKGEENSNWIKYAIPVRGTQYYARLKELKNIGLAPNRIYPGLVGVCGYYKWAWFDPAKNL